MSAPAAAKAAKKWTALFRGAGMNYLDALTVQTTALRKVMKEPMRSEALGKASFRYREFSYTDAKEMPSTEFTQDGVVMKK